MTSRILSCLTAVSPAAPVVAAELAGVTAPGTRDVGCTTLAVNGLGLRREAIFKLHLGALCLPQRSPNPTASVALEAPRRAETRSIRSVGKETITAS